MAEVRWWGGPHDGDVIPGIDHSRGYVLVPKPLALADWVPSEARTITTTIGDTVKVKPNPHYHPPTPVTVVTERWPIRARRDGGRLSYWATPPGLTVE